MSKLGVYLEAYFSFWVFSIPSFLSCPWSTFDGTPYFTFFWIFVMTRFLKVLWFFICWQQHTKVSVLLVYTCLLLWCMFYCCILKLIINVVNRSSIVWRIQFIKCLDDVFVCVFMVIFPPDIIFLQSKLYWYYYVRLIPPYNPSQSWYFIQCLC